jgi:endoglucanase
MKRNSVMNGIRRPRCTALAIAVAALASGALYGAPHASAAAAFDPVTATNGFYVNPNNPAAQWAAAHPSDGRAAAIAADIGAKPMADWFSEQSNVGTYTGAYVGAAANKDTLPVLVAYNIVDRDYCASGAGLGAASESAYDSWIAAFAGGIGARPAVVILEPDAVPDEACMSASQITERDALLNNAINQLHDQAPDTWTYLDAGHPGWLSASTAATYLNSAGLAQARGFSINVSNFHTTADNLTYGQQINADLQSYYGYTKPYVIDTSRNANGSNGSNGQWCNPAGAKLGATDQTVSEDGAELLLWIKTPGDSDGNCGTGAGTTAGEFVPQIAYNLIYGY